MIFDHRTYYLKPGTIKAHLEIYEKYGYGPQSKHLGKPVLYATTEVGDVNSYVHVWAYKDLADRTARRMRRICAPSFATARSSSSIRRNRRATPS